MATMPKKPSEEVEPKNLLDAIQKAVIKARKTKHAHIVGYDDGFYVEDMIDPKTPEEHQNTCMATIWPEVRNVLSDYVGEVK